MVGINAGREAGAGRSAEVWALHLLAVAALSACGGGGGGTDTAAAQTEVAQAVVVVPAPVIDPLPTGLNSFHIKVDDSWADEANIQAQVGGSIQIGWNMADPQRTMTPGMKVAFFGRTPTCTSEISDGPVGAGTDSDFSLASGRTGVATAQVTGSRRWTPTAQVAGCEAVSDRSGPNWMYLNPAASQGGMAVYTTTGPDAKGQAPFLMPTGHAGTDGQGYNANGIANFVAFRHAWYSANAVRPWRNAQGATVEARFLARQSVGAMEVGADNGVAISQVKQQVMFTVINTTCQKTPSAGAPCHVQYLFNTAAARAGVSNWDSYSPPTSAHVWFDQDQGSLPIIDGQVPAAGLAAQDTTYKQTLYRSAGYASQHQAFSELTFDIRISFAELMTAVRQLTAKRLVVDPSAVTDAQIAQLWGADWNNTDKWTLISTTFGQEAHNSEFETRRSWIGGGFSEIYAGPAN